MNNGPVFEPWYRHAVFYQIYTRSFCDSNGDGVGDLAGVTSRLDALVDLGVDGLWVSPFCLSPQIDNGYDVSDYDQVDPSAGSLEDLKTLIAEAHRRGLKVMMDLVLNHSSDQHPWFVESRSSAEHPRRDWYVWAKGRGTSGELPPTNYESYFGGPAWTRDPASGEWYLHHFFAQQPDLNWNTPALRAELAAVVRRWTALGIDALRLDAIHHIGKPEGLPMARPLPPGKRGFLHYKNTPETHRWLAELHQEAFAGANLFTVGETGGTTLAEARLYTDARRHELDAILRFDLMRSLRRREVPRLRRLMITWYRGLSQGGGWDTVFLSNHDVPRHISVMGDDGDHREACAQAYAVFLLTQWGTPFLYQGEELGLPNARFESLGAYRDEASLGQYRRALERGADPAEAWRVFQTYTRDNARTPYPWDAGPGHGFSSAEPWMPHHPEAETLNRAAEAQRPAGVLAAYKALLRLRRAESVLRTGSVEAWGRAHPTVLAYRRRQPRGRLKPGESSRAAVLINLGSAPVTLRLDAPFAAPRLVWPSAQGAPTQAEAQPGRWQPELTLAPWEARLWLGGP